MASSLTPGIYKAKIKDYGFSSPKKEGANPSAMVQFEIIDESPMAKENAETMTWFGSFNGGAQEDHA